MGFSIADFQAAGVAEVFSQYPEQVRRRLMILRQGIFDVAEEFSIEVSETLKWDEPSYLAVRGSTMRLGWKSTKPNQYGLYVHCQTTLIETYRELYGEVFEFEKNRAIIFGMNEDVPMKDVKHCISLSLRYHDLKHLPLLGGV